LPRRAWCAAAVAPFTSARFVELDGADHWGSPAIRAAGQHPAVCQRPGGVKQSVAMKTNQDHAPVLRVGVISDTHGLLRPEAIQRLAGVAHIIHAGDIGRPDVMDGLRRIAPVTAIRGNVDKGPWAEDYPDTLTVSLGGCSIHVVHDVHDLQLDPVSCGIDVVISGHSHRPLIETIGGVLYLNPGSAGPRRFKLPITLATLDLTAGGPRPAIHDLVVGS
jgi:putative phosphoesterase